MFTVSIFESENPAKSYEFNSERDAWEFYYNRGRKVKRGALFLIDNIRHELLDKWEKTWMNEPGFAF